MNAQIHKIKRMDNGNRSIHIRLPNWLSFTLILFVLTGVANIAIFVSNTQKTLTELKDECKDNKIVHQAFIQAFWDLNINIYKYIPSETVVRGAHVENTNNKDAKHEEEVRYNQEHRFD